MVFPYSIGMEFVSLCCSHIPCLGTTNCEGCENPEAGRPFGPNGLIGVVGPMKCFPFSLAFVLKLQS